MTLPCSDQGCDYVINTHFTAMEQLTLHANSAHMRDARNLTKPDKHPRSEARLDMNEHEFRFFKSPWEDYKNSTGIRGRDLLNEFWITMTPDLKKLAFDQGGKDLLDTEDRKMKKIKCRFFTLRYIQSASMRPSSS